MTNIMNIIEALNDPANKTNTVELEEQLKDALKLYNKAARDARLETITATDDVITEYLTDPYYTGIAVGHKTDGEYTTRERRAFLSPAMVAAAYKNQYKAELYDAKAYDTALVRLIHQVAKRVDAEFNPKTADKAQALGNGPLAERYQALVNVLAPERGIKICKADVRYLLAITKQTKETKGADKLLCQQVNDATAERRVILHLGKIVSGSACVYDTTKSKAASEKLAAAAKPAK